ncbi:Ig-like domain-containing protein [Butyrivibrio sp. WCD3002]|uniref:Ig-like domain-containing protein n=1 Tax=Butyrivibrio sp. WCD3002 TaxID=1280676 RepID=UPI000419773B|nr:Ig-like domain-containing protein [Butyrivibrio sp. WCD3002]
MERKGVFKRFRGRIKGLAALGLAVVMAFGMMPAMQAKAAINAHYSIYYFVRSGDDARLYGDNWGSGGDIFGCSLGEDFSGNEVIDANLNLTPYAARHDIASLADKSDMQNTITVKDTLNSGFFLAHGFVGKTGNFTTYLDGQEVRSFGDYEEEWKKEFAKSIEVPILKEIKKNEGIVALYRQSFFDWVDLYVNNEYDITLNTANKNWILDIVTVKKVKEIAFDKAEVNFKQGDAGQKLAISPKLNLNRFDWTSSDANVATVDATGTVTPVNGGTATITATLKSNTSIKATCTVNVEGKEPTVDRSKDTLKTGLKISQKKNKTLVVKWDKEADAAKYEVYASCLGKKNADKIETTANSAQVSTIGGKNIDPKKNYEIYVVAYDAKGNKIGTSLKAFVAGKDSKNTNAKKITANKKVSLKAGKTVKVKVNVKLADSKKKALAKKYASDVRYLSTDTGVATVSKSGKIKGVAPGTCTVLAIAKNGLAAKIKVTVK